MDVSVSHRQCSSEDNSDYLIYRTYSSTGMLVLASYWLEIFSNGRANAGGDVFAEDKAVNQ